MSLKAPYRSVSANTLSRWIRSILKSAGIDTTVFGAHSTRGAAASKAFAGGASTDSILRAGHWASESTFARFYRRETIGSSLASSILGLRPLE